MIRAQFFIVALIFCAQLFAAPFNQSYKEADFKSAYDAESRLHFIGKSSKMGLITSEFEGVVKEFTAKGDFTPPKFLSVVVSFKVESLDTDVGARNEKMYDLCFERAKYPELSISVAELDLTKGENQDIAATITIRGKSFPITLKSKVTDGGEAVLIDGSAEGGFKAFEIPDPSIMIAKVKDKIVMNFKIKIKKP